MQIESWKLDVSIWYEGVPPEVEAFQAELPGRLTPESRLAILRLKDAWHRLPEYPEIVGAWEVYDAVLNHGVRSPAGFDAFLASRRLPGRRSAASDEQEPR